MAPQNIACSRRCWSRVRGLILAGGWFIGTPVLLLVSAEPVDPSARETMAPLNGEDAVERINSLRAEIAFHDDLYFKKSAPVISDGAYDQLKRELAALEKTFPESARNERPSAGVGDDRTGGFAPYSHRVRMLSLNKSYSESELRAFDARLQKQLTQSDLEYVVEPKFDGLAISVTFENGKLVRAVTRGNGVEGDDVTANVRTIHALPAELAAIRSGATSENSVPDLIELRGEVYLTFAEFERINREQEATGETPFANPRNLAAGTLKQLDAREVARRQLEIVFYGIGACEPASARPISQVNLLAQLRAWGLPTVDEPRIVRGADAMWRAVQAVGRERAKLKFPIDGAVVKLNEVVLQELVGVTTQAPLWAMAYKFMAERGETRLKAITWQVGRTGVLTPVAELVPVKLGGSTVARASLYNRDEIARRDIRVGDFVYVEKAGEIVPAIASVNRTRRTPDVQRYVAPTECPDCFSRLTQSVSEAALRCPNLHCPTQIKRRVEYFASKACVSISGLGPATIDRLVQGGRVKSVADLYRLRREDFLLTGSKSARSADVLLAAIDASRQADLARFIHGLGIPQVGPVAARRLAVRFGGLAELARASREDFMQDGRPLISGVGEGVSRAVLGFFAQPDNQALIQDLLESRVQPAAVFEGEQR